MAVKNRWYERNPVFAEAMDVWEAFPKPLQKTLAEQIQLLAKRKRITLRNQTWDTFRQNHWMVISSNTKLRRWYDWDTQLRQTLTLLSQAEHGDMFHMSEQILYLNQHFKRMGIRPETLPKDDLDSMVENLFRETYRL